MEITVTGPHELICGKKEFQEIVAKCEEAIKAGYTRSDPVAGMNAYIGVDDVNVEDWMRPVLEDIYTKAGWEIISFRYIGEIRFVLPTKRA